jgi:hypothetical protein
MQLTLRRYSCTPDATGRQSQNRVVQHAAHAQVPFKVPQWLTLPCVPAADELDAALRTHGMRPPYLCKVEQVSCPTTSCMIQSPATTVALHFLAFIVPLLPPFLGSSRHSAAASARRRRAVLRKRTTWRCSAAERISPAPRPSLAQAPSPSRPAEHTRRRLRS